VRIWLKSLFGMRLTHAEYRLKYHEYLLSSKWKKIRAKVLKRDGNRCRYRRFYLFRCKGTKNLQVHHKNYKNVFNEKLKDLVTLCRYHHEKVHKKSKK
jgi:5-methylcytosine-specific restriction endonuclease McrA